MTFKTAVIGSGLIATVKHLPALGRLRDQTELVAVCDVDEEKARSIASKFGVPRYYTNIDELLEREKPDLVDVCTPPRTHVALAVKALQGGAHVLVEKPLATNTEDCDRIIEAARQADRQICVGHSDLFYPSFLQARQMVESGAIGTFRGMRIFLMTPMDYITSRPDHWAHALPGGVVGETGPHVIYMTLPFINPIAEVSVHGQKILHEYAWSPFEDYRIELVGENATSTITLAYTTKHWAAQVEFWGTDGLIRADLESQAVVLYRRPSLKPAVVAFSALSEPLQIIRTTMSTALRYARGQVDKTHDLLIRSYIEAIKQGKPSPVPAIEGRESVRILDLIAESLAARRGA